MSDYVSQLPTKLYSAEQVRELDRIAIEEEGIPGISLMRRAGTAAYEELKQTWPEAKRIGVICGLGNNAGDGYVLARLALLEELDVSVFQMGNTNLLKGDAKVSFDDLISTGIEVQSIQQLDLTKTDVIVDALFGTGLDREITGEWKQLIETVNHSRTPVLSLDIPSGLDANSGMPKGCCICAAKTITFIGMKQGLLTGQSVDYSGEVVFADLAVPATVYEKLQATTERIDFQNLKVLLPARSRSAHKGDFGHVLVIGGDKGYAGAARMAAEAAARTGAGLVSVATRAANANTLNIGRPELMVHPVESYSDLGPLLARASVLAVGPGLGQSDWAMQLFARIAESDKPQVLDADALNLLAKEPNKQPNRILTPHPGEAARLLGTSINAIQQDRFLASSELQNRYGGVIVLKGAGTLVADQEGKVFVCTDGNPGMATGGMGDVLTGVIAALLAQGLELDAAAKLAVCLHARAADEAAILGERGLLASDLMPYLRYLINP